jgi:hypothetical protein
MRFPAAPFLLKSVNNSNGKRRKRTMRKMMLLVSAAIFAATTAFAAHPLITDDTGTQGKGKFQLELLGEHARESDDGTTAKTTEIWTVLSYGLADDIDLILGVPFQSYRIKEEGLPDSSERGFSDVSLEMKWRFYEKDGLSFGLKPALTLPTGNEEKLLGPGKAGYSLHFLASKELGAWEFHTNLGYIRNENKLDERENLWEASIAAGVEVAEGLKLVGNLGIERSADRLVDRDPAFILGGIIYALTENIDVDLGIRAGLNRPGSDYAVLTGIAWRF